MNPAQIKAIVEGIIPELKAFIATAQEPLIRRIAELEARSSEKGDKGDPGKDGRDGVDGKDADPALIAKLVEDAVAKVPPAKDGRDGVDGKDGRDGVDGKDADPALIAKLVEDAVAKVPPAKDGRDGQPGVPGRDGKDGSPGADGKDGRDGLGMDDVTEEYEDDGRVMVRRYVRGGEIIKEFRHVTLNVIDRGVWREGTYLRGDGCTWGGSFWIAQRETTAKPDTKDSGWRLAVKRGIDGRDGKPGERGPEGPKGDRGERGSPAYAS